jgi:hypothetical protein
MQIRFQASESIQIQLEDKESSIQHYLRQPQRLVKAIANPNLMEQVADFSEPSSIQMFRLKMQPINFMELYHFQPTVLLKVWTGANGILYLQSLDCEIRGIDYIDRRFSLNLQGKLYLTEVQGLIQLQGKADLEVKVDLPPALWFTPKPLLEMAGNGLLKSILLRIKQKLLNQLLEDYRQWANDIDRVPNLAKRDRGEPAQNPIV